MAAKADPILTPPSPTTDSAHQITPTQRVGDRLRFSAKASPGPLPVAGLPSPLDRIGQPDRNLPKSGTGWASLISFQSPHASLGKKKSGGETVAGSRQVDSSLLFLLFLLAWSSLYPPVVCFAIVLLYQLILLGFGAEGTRTDSWRSHGMDDGIYPLFLDI